MIDDTPYIIVDNQKIPPIGRSPRPNSAAEDRAWREEQPFGVVDRVTISRQAREIARQHQGHGEADPQALNDLPPKPKTLTIPLLTYPPKSRLTSCKESAD